MTDLRVLAVTPWTATILLCPPGGAYDLAAPVRWSLQCAGDIGQVGSSSVALLFVEWLRPGTAYRLETDLGTVSFDTPACAGLVAAGDHGVAVGNGAAQNAAAFARAIAAVPEGGTLVVPPGRVETGPLFLKPGMTFWLPKGSTLAAPGNREGWPILPARDDTGRVCGTWEGLPEASFAALLTGIDCDGLHLTGAGVVDGGGDRGDWWTWPKEVREGARRPRTVFIAHARDVALTGLTVRNSPSWTVHPYRCDGLLAAALTIENPADSPNTDGLNPESCTDVALTGLRFSVGDDCIAVKAGKRGPGQETAPAPTRNLRVTHCLMARGHGAVVLGSEMSGDITDVEIARCTFVGTDRGLRIKTRRGRGGTVARVRMQDVEMRGVATPVAVNTFYFCDADGKSEAVQSRVAAAVDETTPRIADIEIDRVTATGVTQAAVALLGLPEAPITGVRIGRFTVSFDPQAEAGVPLMACGVAACRHVPLMADFASVTGAPEVIAAPVLAVEETAPC